MVSTDKGNSPSRRVVHAIDDLCDRFEEELTAGNSPSIEQYLGKIEPPHQATLLQELVRLEIETSKGRKKLEDYVARFPDHSAAIKLAFEHSKRRDGTHRKSSRRVGRYKLLQEIGSGGMGTVWMAQQEKPVRRRVALKLIKPGIVDDKMIARFEAERQVVAMMDHPNIARVLDAGDTVEGSPYFVMELVQGIPITKYCDQHLLTLHQRLELFIPVCRALQHAHQKGIIHRDLKPTNILVTVCDGEAVPKVIDFGLAKSYRGELQLTEKTMFTQFGQVMGTVQYMSPEQASLDRMGMDTRSDIYSLGVMLYELLTGSTPIEQDTLRNKNFHEVLEIIRDKDPPRPSFRLSTGRESIAAIGQNRKTHPEKLKRILRRDLDWIVMKALEQDRNRRYQTATDFAEDIRRYLDGEAITARPPTLLYTTTKFARKNSKPVAALLAIALSLLTATIFSTSSYLDAEHSRSAEAEARAEADKLRSIADDERDQALAAKARSDYIVTGARWRETRVRDALTRLEAIDEKYRDFEWMLDRKLFEGCDLSFYGHSQRVYSVAYRPDGKRLISASADGTVRLWDTDTQEQVMQLDFGRIVFDAAYSPDGTKIACICSDGTIRVCNAETGEVKSTFNHIAPDDVRRQLLAIRSTSKKIESAMTPELVDKIVAKVKWPEFVDAIMNKAELREHNLLTEIPSVERSLATDIFVEFRKRLYGGIAFSPDSQQIASVGFDESVKTWNLTDGTSRLLGRHDEPILAVAFSPDSRHVATASLDKTVKVWNLATGDAVSLAGHQFAVRDVTFSPDGRRVASASTDKTVCIWDAQSGKRLNTLFGHSHEVYGVTFSPDGECLASSSFDETIRIWGALTGREIHKLRGDNWIRSVSFSPDGSRLVASAAKIVQTWDATTGMNVRSLRGHRTRITDLRYSPDGKRLASASTDKTVRVWSTANGEQLMLFQHNEEVNSIDFSPDGNRLMTGSVDGAVRLFDLTSGSEILPAGAPEEFFKGRAVKCVAFSPDGRYAAQGSADKRVKLWELETNKLRILRHDGEVRSLDFIPGPNSNWLASGSTDKTIRLWETATGASGITIPAHAKAIYCVRFSPDGLMIGSASKDDTAKIWNARTGEQIGSTLRADGGDFYSLAFRTNSFGVTSRMAVACGDGTVRLWDVQNIRTENLAGVEEVRSIQGYENPNDILDGGVFKRAVRAVAFRPDNQQMASGAVFGAIRLWDGRPFDEYISLAHPDTVQCVAISQDGKRVVTANADNVVRCWRDLRTKPTELIGHQRRVAEVLINADGTLVQARDIDGIEITWDVESGRQISAANPEWSSSSEETASNEHWQVILNNTSVLLVNRGFQNSEGQRDFREFKARPETVWHQQQAKDAMNAEHWYSAAFHLSWAIHTSDSPAAVDYTGLRKAYQAWREDYVADQLIDGTSPSEAASNGVLAEASDFDPDVVLSSVVREALSQLNLK